MPSWKKRQWKSSLDWIDKLFNFYHFLPNSHLLMIKTSLSCPATVDGPGCTIHLLCVVAHQKHDHLTNVFRLAELLRWLFGGYQILRSLISWNFLFFSHDFDLPFNKGGQHKARANGIDSDTLFGVFEGYRFCESYNSVLGSNISRLVDGCD